MNIVSSETMSKGRYAVEVDGHTAEMTYSRASPHLIIIDHTSVPDALRGRGLVRHWQPTRSKKREKVDGKSYHYVLSSRLKP